MNIQFKIIFSFIIFSLLLSAAFAQGTSNDSQLANKYFQSKEYDKAEVLYENLFIKTKAQIYFKYYTNCLVEQSKFKEAEKAVKKQIRKNKANIAFYVDLGYIYKKQDKFEQATKQYEKAISKIEDNQNAVRSLAGSFLQRHEYHYAEKTYLKARYITGNPYHNELANVYAIQRKNDQMINEFMEMLTENARNLQTVQGQMQYFITNDDTEHSFSLLLRKNLLKQIQKRNDLIIFNEMLIWLYVQEKDFAGALIQAKAIDKRRRESGKRIFDLAQLAKANNNFDVSAEAYRYVVGKGRRKPYYYKAKFGLLNVLYKQVETGILTKPEDILNLEKDYLNTVKELGINNQTVSVIKDLAHLQAFYLNKIDAAVQLLTEAISVRGISHQLAGECKIELADIQLLQGDIWTAALTYGQAEKENKENQTGDQARLRKAKLAFYAGDFVWAKAQLDALKASTSKLISNDALKLAMLIQDNIAEDTIQDALRMYARADLLFFQHRNNDALLVIDSVSVVYKEHVVNDEALMLKGEILTSMGKFDEALVPFQAVVDNYNFDIFGDVALFKIAVIYDKIKKNPKQAQEYYKRVMLDHPDSFFVTQARKRFREIRDN